MFTNVHFGKENSHSPEYMFGLIFPDIYSFKVYGRQILSEKDTHFKGEDFKKWNTLEKYNNFALGWIEHEKLDLLVDKRFNGSMLTHILDEFQADLFFSSQHESVESSVLNTLNKVDVNELSDLLADFYSKDSSDIKILLSRFIYGIKLYEYSMNISRKIGLLRLATELLPFEKIYSDLFSDVQLRQEILFLNNSR